MLIARFPILTEPAAAPAGRWRGASRLMRSAGQRDVASSRGAELRFDSMRSSAAPGRGISERSSPCIGRMLVQCRASPVTYFGIGYTSAVVDQPPIILVIPCGERTFT